MKYNFGFTGGIVKHTRHRIVSKFLLFHLVPDMKTGKVEEKIFFHSLRSGFITNKYAFPDPIAQHPKLSVLSGDQISEPDFAPKEGEMNYQTEYPNFKLFTLVEGFGVQKQFYSFYLTLDIHENIVTVLPLYSEQQNQSFIGRCRFISTKDVQEIIGKDSVSFAFYKKQLPLAKSLMNRLVIYGKGSDAGISPSSGARIRKVRL